jgi:hypothetical protein
MGIVNVCVGVSRSVRFFLPTSGGFTHIVCFFFFSPSLSIAYNKAKEFFYSFYLRLTINGSLNTQGGGLNVKVFFEFKPLNTRWI